MSKIIVADLYQLAILDGKFSKEHTKLLRKGAKVEESYFKQVNSNSEDSGKLYILDKEATKEYNEKIVNKNKTKEPETKAKPGRKPKTE
jgi:hypothetical protein